MRPHQIYVRTTVRVFPNFKLQRSAGSGANRCFGDDLEQNGDLSRLSGHDTRKKYPYCLFFVLRPEPSRGRVSSVIFSESPTFTKTVQQILREDDYFALQDLLIDRPDAGDVIPGSKGLRKIRVASGGKGKRGGSRVIYYWYVEPEKIQFCRIYEKSNQASLSRNEIDQIQTELDP